MRKSLCAALPAFSLFVALAAAAPSSSGQRLSDTSFEAAKVRASRILAATTIESADYDAEHSLEFSLANGRSFSFILGRGDGLNSEGVRASMCFVIVIPQGENPYFIPTVGVAELEAIGCGGATEATVAKADKDAEIKIRYSAASPNASGETSVVIAWKARQKRFVLVSGR